MYAASFMIISQSCMDDEGWVDRYKPNIETADVLDHGVIILNEGNYMYGNASITYYDQVTKKVFNDVFYSQNGIPLGDVAQSAMIFQGELYVVLNNSGKIMVMNMGRYPSLKAFEFTHKITGLISPRYLYFQSRSKAYISDLYARQISIMDPGSYMLTGSIDVNNRNADFYQHPTEQFIAYKELLFTNCYSFDNQILVIDTNTDRLVDSIEVLSQPNSMIIDRNNKIWILCDGGYEGSDYPLSDPGLVRMDPETRTVEKIFIIENGVWPSELSINGSRDTLYFINGDIWRMPVNSASLPDTPFIKSEDISGKKLFYSLGIDPVNSDVYVGDAVNHVQEGIVYRYSAKAIPVDTIRAGIIPGFFCFTGIK
jgi:DNA-binding beta-propeller fold protein YncE